MTRRLKLEEPLSALITNGQAADCVNLLTKVQVICDRTGVEFGDKFPVSASLLQQIQAYIEHNVTFFNEIHQTLSSPAFSAYKVMEMHPLYAFVRLRDHGLELVLQFKAKGNRLIFQIQPFDLPNKLYFDALLDSGDYNSFFDTLLHHLHLFDFIHNFERKLIDCSALEDPTCATRNIYFVPLEFNRFSISFHLRFYEEQRPRSPGHAIIHVFAAPGTKKLFFSTAYDNVAAFDLFHGECKAQFPTLTFARDALSFQYASSEELIAFFRLFLTMVYAYLSLLQGFRYVG